MISCIPVDCERQPPPPAASTNRDIESLHRKQPEPLGRNLTRPADLGLMGSALVSRFFKVGSLGLLVAVLALYLGDLAVFSARVRKGSAYGVVTVNQFLTTPLKGQKEEFDVIGTIQVTCARSIFPQPGAPACWWVRRHTAQWQ